MYFLRGLETGSIPFSQELETTKRKDKKRQTFQNRPVPASEVSRNPLNRAFLYLDLHDHQRLHITLMRTMVACNRIGRVVLFSRVVGPPFPSVLFKRDANRPIDCEK